VTGEGIDGLRIYFPMLVFDGLERSVVELSANSAVLRLRDGGVRFKLLKPAGARLRGTGRELGHRNGVVEPLFAQVRGNRAVFSISGVRAADE
jgi:hypothetical protein